MSKLREAYDHIQQEKAKWIQGHLARNYFIDQEKRYVHPFHMFGNIWYVGDSWRKVARRIRSSMTKPGENS